MGHSNSIDQARLFEDTCRPGTGTEYSLIQLIGTTIIYVALAYNWALFIATVPQKLRELWMNAGYLWELDLTTYRVIVVAMGCSTALFQILVGIVSDRMITRLGNRRTYLLSGVLFSVIGVQYYVVADSPEAIAIYSLLLIWALSFLSVSCGALLSDRILPSAFGMASSLLSFFAIVGLSPVLIVSLFNPGFYEEGSIAFGMGTLGAFLLVVLGWITLFVVNDDIAPSKTVDSAACPRTRKKEYKQLLLLVVSRILAYVSPYAYLLTLRSMSVLDEFAGFFVSATIGALIATLAGSKLSLGRDKHLLLVVSAVVGVVCSQLIILQAYTYQSPLAVALLGMAAGSAYGLMLSNYWALGLAATWRRPHGLSMGIWNLSSLLPMVLVYTILLPVEYSWGWPFYSLYDFLRGSFPANVFLLFLFCSLASMVILWILRKEDYSITHAIGNSGVSP